MWIVFNIGCIECGVTSAVVGLFADKSKADALAEALGDSHSWRESGQNHFAVFALPEAEQIADEYTRAPA